MTDLVPLNPDERTKEIQSLIAPNEEEAWKKGETAIMKLADKKGDEAAIQIISQLNPLEIARLLKSGDTSVPSMTSFLANPEQIAKMLSMDSLAWERELKDADVDYLQHVALDLLCQILLHAEPERQKQILLAIGDDDNAFAYLCFPFLGKNIKIERLEMNLNPLLKVNEMPVSHIDSDAVGVENDTQCDFSQESGADLIEHEQEAHLYNVDMTYVQMLKDVYAIIHEATPDLADRLGDFINQLDEMHWDNILELIEAMSAKAETQLEDPAEKEEDTDEEFTKMFDAENEK